MRVWRIGFVVGAGLAPVLVASACVGEDPTPTAPNAPDGASDGIATGDAPDDGGDANVGSTHGCTIDGEAFDFCDSFDDKTASAPLTPEWTTTSTTPGSALLRTTETAVSRPQSLAAETPLVRDAPNGGYSSAQSYKTFTGAVSHVVVEASMRVNAPDVSDSRANYPIALATVSLFAGAALFNSAIVASSTVVDGGRVESFAAQTGDDKSSLLSPFWSSVPLWGTWHRFRRELTIEPAAGELHETVRLDDAQVLDWRTPLPPGFTVTRAEVSVGLFAAYLGDGGGQPAWTAYYDDVRIAVSR